jgi:hypothetical protein
MEPAGALLRRLGRLRSDENHRTPIGSAADRLGAVLPSRVRTLVIAHVRRPLSLSLMGIAVLIAGVLGQSATAKPSGSDGLAVHAGLTSYHLTAKRQQARPVIGVDIATGQNYSLAQATTYGARLMPYIKRTLHATAVGIVWDLCDPSFTSDKVERCAQSLSVPDVRELIAQAHAAKLSVQLRPIIRVGPPSQWNDPAKSWEGDIHPRKQHAWFASLLRAERPYLNLLGKGSQIVTGTELGGVAQSRNWRWFLRRVADDCHRCSVSIAIWHNDYSHSILTSAVGQPGVDWYPGLSVSAGASQKRVTAALEASLRKIPRALLRRTVLDEVSIRATAGAYHDPSDWNKGGRADAEVQARYFTATCQTAAHYKMAGLYFYDIPLDDNPAQPFTFPAFFVGNSGGRAIARCAA